MEEFKPKCIWCSAPWSDENVRIYDIDAADHCESGRFGPETACVSIGCHACGREMYRKNDCPNSYEPFVS